jgi:hypothetical protein
VSVDDHLIDTSALRDGAPLLFLDVDFTDRG